MIEYNKGLFGVPALFHFHGSVLPRCVFPAMLSAMITYCFRWLGAGQIHDKTYDEVNAMTQFSGLHDNYEGYGDGAFKSLGVVVAFLLVYRLQQGYARYWQARLAFQRMSAYWGSAFMHACFFAKKAPHRIPMETKVGKERNILHGANFSKSFFGSAMHAAADDVQVGHVRQSLSERKRLVASRVIRRLVSRALAHAFDGWHDFLLERKRKIHLSLKLMSKAKIKKEEEVFAGWSEYVRQQNPHRFFDDVMHLSSLLHATACMSLRWDIDFHTNLIAFDPNDNNSCPPSPAHVNLAGRRTLMEFLLDIFFCRISGERRHKHYNATAKLGVIYGITQEEKEALTRSHNACHLVLCWLTSTVARRYQTDVFVDAPVTSRIFHELNQGHMAYMEAHAVTCTPYPLPLAQMTNLVIIIFTMLLAPIQFAAVIQNPFWAMFLNFFCTLLFMGVSEASRELEDPFVGHPNDLPLAFLHGELNLGLIDLIKEPWPHRSVHSDVLSAFKTAEKPSTTPSRTPSGTATHSESTPSASKAQHGLRRSLTISENMLMDSEDSGGEEQDRQRVSLPGAVHQDLQVNDSKEAVVIPGNDRPVAQHVEMHNLPPGVPLELPPPVRASYQRPGQLRRQQSFRNVASAVEICNSLADERIANRNLC